MHFILQASPKMRLAFITLLLLLAGFIWAYDMDRVWIGYYDGDGAFFHNVVNNYHRYGLSETGGRQLLTHATLPPEEWDPYVHFPPLFPLIAYGGTELWGLSEFSLRLTTWFITLLSAALVYRLMGRLFNWRVGFLATVFFAFSPMVIFLARIPEYEQLATLFILAALVAYSASLRQPDQANRFYLLTALAMACAAWVGWAVYTFAVALFLHALLFGGRKQQIATFLLGGVVGLMGLSYALYLQLSTAGGVSTLIDRYSYRSSLQAGSIEGAETYSMADFFVRMLARLMSGYTPTVFVFALFALFLLWLRPLHWSRLPLGERLLPAVLILGGGGYALMVRQATYLHEYLWYYTGVGLVLMAAPALGLLWERWSKPSARFLLLFLVFCFFAASVRATDQYRTFNVVNERYEIASALNAAIVPDESIMTNLPNVMLHGFHFYAQTGRIDWAREAADFSNNPVYSAFLECNLDDQEVRDWGADYRLIALDHEGCQLVRRIED